MTSAVPTLIWQFALMANVLKEKGPLYNQCLQTRTWTADGCRALHQFIPHIFCQAT